MLTVTLIATIIHMNMGFELPEAFWRGLGSAAICAAAGLALYLVIIIIGGIYYTIKEKLQ